MTWRQTKDMYKWSEWFPQDEINVTRVQTLLYQLVAQRCELYLCVTDDIRTLKQWLAIATTAHKKCADESQVRIYDLIGYLEQNWVQI